MPVARHPRGSPRWSPLHPSLGSARFLDVSRPRPVFTFVATAGMVVRRTKRLAVQPPVRPPYPAVTVAVGEGDDDRRKLAELAGCPRRGEVAYRAVQLRWDRHDDPTCEPRSCPPVAAVAKPPVPSPSPPVVRSDADVEDRR